MVSEELEYLLNEFLLKLKRNERQVLVIGFGCNQEEEHIFSFLKKNQNHCRYKFAFSAAYQAIFDVSKWSELGEVIAELDLNMQEELQRIAFIAVPYLTRNSLAKLSLGIADNLPLTLINQGLLMGKKIVVSNHCWQMDTPFAAFKGIDQNVPLKSIYDTHEENIKKMGIHSLSLPKWRAAVEELLNIDETDHTAFLKHENLPRQSVLTLNDVKTNPENYLNSTNKMTDLAREYLEKYAKKGDTASGI